MFCKNRITLIGHLGKDAETRFTTRGTPYSRFSIATNGSWKDKESGEYRTRTEWHACVVWTNLAAWAASLKRGPLWKSRVNSGIASSSRRVPTSKFARRKST